MKKIEKTYNKIVADEELKSRIADNLLTQATTKQSDMSDAPVKTIYKQPARSTRRRFNFRRITAMAVSFILVLVIGVLPLLRTGFNLPNITNPGGNEITNPGGNEITNPGGNEITNPGGNVIIDSGENPFVGEIGGGIIDPSYADLSPRAMAPVTFSREELIDKFLYNNDNSGDIGVGDDVDEEELKSNDSNASGEDDYAKTNVQHEGVDEGDIIKVDGGFIYSLSQEGLVIVSTSDIMEVTCKIKYTNFYPDEMFIFGDQLIVIGGKYTQYYYNQSGMDDWADDSCMVPWYGYRSCTRVIVYNLNDRINVEKLCEYDITGYFITSRLIEGRLNGQ